MPETTASPTMQEVLLIRDDLEDFLPDGRTLDSYVAQSLLECKRILEDERDCPWSRVFDSTTDAYLDNSDATGRNQDRIQNAISHMTASLIFRGYAIRNGLEENWTLLADEHLQMAKDRLLNSTLDIDRDDSGAVDEDEEGATGQVFMVK